MKTQQQKRKWLTGIISGAVLGLAAIWWLRRQEKHWLQSHLWQPLYDRFAWLYDAVDWFTASTTHRLRRRALRYLPPPGAHLLEVGFGSGRLHAELAARYTTAGVDLAPGMAFRTQARLRSQHLASALCVGDAVALPWADESFDAVLLTFTFSAIPDADAALDDMIRVLRPGGKLVIIDAGEARDGNLVAQGLASLWSLIGDYMRDEVPLMAARGLDVRREDYGPWHSVHATVGVKPLMINSCYTECNAIVSV